MKKLVLASILTMCSSITFADCFTATGSAMKDGQTLRKNAISMGWKVGKASSITAGTFIKGKAKLYPQEKVTVCMRESSSEGLQFKAQSASSDADEAIWRNLPAEQK